jgi:dTDP-4-dehydrorhamnose reductase
MPMAIPERAVILGATGQLGGEFRHLLPSAVALSRTDADLTRPDELRSVLSTERPQLVINCAAYNQVDQAEREPEAALAVNALGVRNLATICRDLQVRLVHFSTDAVFGQDQERQSPITELTLPGPVNVYGASKLLGEHFVRAICPDGIIIRTCGLYGRRGTTSADHGGKGTNFVESILAQASSGGELRVVDDQTCTPSFAEDIAKATLSILGAGRPGLFHVTNGGFCTWFGFAKAILNLSGLTAPLVPISSDEWRAAAVRPRYSVLSCDRYRTARLPPLALWQGALERYLRGDS